MDDPKFKMTEPQKLGTETTYAFWLQTADTRLIEFVEKLICVASVDRTRAEKRVLVSLHDEYDADEAWHYIRTELEVESQYVYLDKIWEDALWL